MAAHCPNDVATALPAKLSDFHAFGQRAILAVEALVVGLAVPPGLAVADDQVFRPIDPRDPAGVLDARHALAELPLPAPRQNDLPLLGDRHRGIGDTGSPPDPPPHTCWRCLGSMEPGYTDQWPTGYPSPA
jgi:hypothetical protein